MVSSNIMKVWGNKKRHQILQSRKMYRTKQDHGSRIILLEKNIYGDIQLPVKGCSIIKTIKLRIFLPYLRVYSILQRRIEALFTSILSQNLVIKHPRRKKKSHVNSISEYYQYIPYLCKDQKFIFPKFQMKEYKAYLKM